MTDIDHSHNDEFLDDLKEMIEWFFKHAKPVSGEVLAIAVTDEVRQRYQGSEVYIKKGGNLTPVIKGRIRSEFNGHNYGVLMRRYDISRSTVYRTVRSLKK